MSPGASLALVIGVAVLALVLRATPIIMLSEVGIPGWLERALGFVAPAVLASLAVNFAFGGLGGPNIEWSEVVTLLVAVGVAIKYRHLLIVLAISMPTLWLFSWAL